ncbi:MAG: FtsQ-type POTRA domain-containing protein [Verrucomicrobia bacterium]|nr:FtsQ-type POTRA domain-containing protein [Verrucomicrobiota bacterium]
MHRPIVVGKEAGKQAMIIQKRMRKGNKRASTARQRKSQHLLDVKVRAKKVAARRIQRVLLTMCGFILITSMLGGIAFGAKRIFNALFFANADYALQAIEVTSDGNLTREAILRAADVVEGKNIFSISLPEVQERLAALPQVEESRIQRVLPNKLVISVQERRPVAWVVPPDTNLNSFNFESAYLVDRRGILLKTKSLAAEYLGLPLIVGVDTSNCQAGQPLAQDDVKAALDLIRASAEILQGRFQIQTIDVSKSYCLTVTDKQHASVAFGTDDIESQLHRLGILLNYCDKNSRELRTVNLMAQRNVPVTFVQETQSTAPNGPAGGSSVGPSSGETPHAEIDLKPGSTNEGASLQSDQSKSTSQPNGSKLQEKKLQQKREHTRLKSFREGRSSGPPPAGQEGRQSSPPVRRALPLETTRLNG